MGARADPKPLVPQGCKHAVRGAWHFMNRLPSDICTRHAAINPQCSLANWPTPSQASSRTTLLQMDGMRMPRSMNSAHLQAGG